MKGEFNGNASWVGVPIHPRERERAAPTFTDMHKEKNTMLHQELAPRLEFTGFSAQQREHLAAAKQLIAPLVSSALDRFYETAERTEATRSFFQDRSHMGRAKAAQEEHWRKIADGSFDGSYYESVRRIGATHARIGLEPRWYVGAYAIVLEGLMRGLLEERPGLRLGRRGDASRVDAVVAVVKAALLDLELSISIYFEQSEAERNKAMAGLAAREEELTKLISSIAESALAIRTGSGEIAQASEDLARRTESNAASLEETSAAIAQMDERLKATAGSATRTVERADQATATVSGGRAIADEAVQAMGRVSESAKGIDNVIEGLDKIAFQTRVLAMNAAVEAGRAGEAGRGFAVVADLVSALSMRAEEESKRARDQLTVTQTDIVTAVDAVKKVDGALANISGDVGEVNELLGAIAADNQAQASAITEISAAISSMDQATQQNAAMVEETSAAARNLLVEVNALSEQAQQFNDGEAAPAARPRTPVPAAAPRAFTSAVPAKPLPAAAVAALTRPDDDWKEF